MKLRFGVAVFTFLLCLFLTSHLGNYSITQAAENLEWMSPQTILAPGTQTPIGLIKSVKNYDINNNGTIVFSALISKEDNSVQEGLFIRKNDLITKILTQGEVLPDGAHVKFFTCGLSISDFDEVAFEVVDESSVPYLYFYNSNSFTKISKFGDTTPIGGKFTGSFACFTAGLSDSFFSFNLDVNNEGQVIFGSTISGAPTQAAIFRWQGGNNTLVKKQGESLPQDFFQPTFTNWQLRNDGSVVYQVFGQSPINQGFIAEWREGLSTRLFGNGDNLPTGSTARFVCNFSASSIGKGLVISTSFIQAGVEKIGIYKVDDQVTKVVMAGEILSDGEPFYGGRGVEECDRFPSSNLHNIVTFLGRSYPGGPGNKIYIAHGESLLNIDDTGFASKPFITNDDEIIYQVAGTEIRSVKPKLHTPPKEKRALIYIQGITSESSCDGSGFLNRAPSWLNDYLKNESWIKSNVEISAVAYFSYRDPGSNQKRYCDGGNGSNGATPEYTSRETCDRGIDESYYGQLKELIKGVTDKNLGAKVTLIAHSQGGLIATYLVGRLRTEDPEFLANRVASVVTFDSFPEGLPVVVINPLKLFYLQTCFRPPNVDDWYEGSVVAKVAKTATQYFTDSHGNLSKVKFYTLDAMDGFVPNEVTDIKQEVLHDRIPGDDHSTIWAKNEIILSAQNKVTKQDFVGCAVILATSCGIQRLVDPLLPGQTQFLTTNIVSGSSHAEFTAAWIGSTVKFSLIKPDGRRVDEDSLLEGWKFVKGANYATYSINDPEPGLWEFELFGQDLPEMGEPVNVFINVSTPPDITAPVSYLVKPKILLGKVPFSLNYISTDSMGINKAPPSGVAFTELWYRKSSSVDQTKFGKLLPEKIKPSSVTVSGKWSNWSKYQQDGISEFSLSPIPFSPNGSGIYEFYTVAVDNRGNRESIPSKEDGRYLCIDFKTSGWCLMLP